MTVIFVILVIKMQQRKQKNNNRITQYPKVKGSLVKQN